MLLLHKSSSQKIITAATTSAAAAHVHVIFDGHVVASAQVHGFVKVGMGKSASVGSSIVVDGEGRIVHVEVEQVPSTDGRLKLYLLRRVLDTLPTRVVPIVELSPKRIAALRTSDPLFSNSSHSHLHPAISRGVSSPFFDIRHLFRCRMSINVMTFSGCNIVHHHGSVDGRMMLRAHRTDDLGTDRGFSVVGSRRSSGMSNTRLQSGCGRSDDVSCNNVVISGRRKAWPYMGEPIIVPPPSRCPPRLQRLQPTLYQQ